MKLLPRICFLLRFCAVQFCSLALITAANAAVEENAGVSNVSGPVPAFTHRTQEIRLDKSVYCVNQYPEFGIAFLDAAIEKEVEEFVESRGGLKSCRIEKNENGDIITFERSLGYELSAPKSSVFSIVFSGRYRAGGMKDAEDMTWASTYDLFAQKRLQLGDVFWRWESAQEELWPLLKSLSGYDDEDECSPDWIKGLAALAAEYTNFALNQDGLTLELGYSEPSRSHCRQLDLSKDVLQEAGADTRHWKSDAEIEKMRQEEEEDDEVRVTGPVPAFTRRNRVKRLHDRVFCKIRYPEFGIAFLDKIIQANLPTFEDTGKVKYIAEVCDDSYRIERGNETGQVIPQEFSSGYSLYATRPGILSIVSGIWYYDGLRPRHGNWAQTYDLDAKKRLRLVDIFPRWKTAKKKLSALLKDDEDEGSCPDFIKTISPDYTNFYLSPDGLNLKYNMYYSPSHAWHCGGKYIAKGELERIGADMSYWQREKKAKKR